MTSYLLFLKKKDMSWFLPSLLSPKDRYVIILSNTTVWLSGFSYKPDKYVWQLARLPISKHKVKMNATTLTTSAKSDSIFPFTVLIHNGQNPAIETPLPKEKISAEEMNHGTR